MIIVERNTNTNRSRLRFRGNFRATPGWPIRTTEGADDVALEFQRTEVLRFSDSRLIITRLNTTRFLDSLARSRSYLNSPPPPSHIAITIPLNFSRSSDKSPYGARTLTKISGSLCDLRCAYNSITSLSF